MIDCFKEIAYSLMIIPISPRAQFSFFLIFLGFRFSDDSSVQTAVDDGGEL